MNEINIIGVDYVEVRSGKNNNLRRNMVFIKVTHCEVHHIQREKITMVRNKNRINVKRSNETRIGNNFVLTVILLQIEETP